MHQVNIFIHVIAGTIALLSGLVAMIVFKGGTTHRKSGKIFLYSFIVLIASALLGVFIFRGTLFLLVITMQSFFQLFMGYQALRRKAKGPAKVEAWVTLLVITSAILYIWYIKTAAMIWSPVIIFSTMGYMFILATYKSSSFFFPLLWHKKLWFYEHIVNMIGAWSAALAAFSGTVLKQWHPYSQFMPSVLGFIIIIAFVLYYSANKKRLPTFVTNL